MNDDVLLQELIKLYEPVTLSLAKMSLQYVKKMSEAFPKEMSDADKLENVKKMIESTSQSLINGFSNFSVEKVFDKKGGK